MFLINKIVYIKRPRVSASVFGSLLFDNACGTVVELVLKN